MVCGKRGKTGGGWLYRAVRRFHPGDRKSLKNRSGLCWFGMLTSSTGEFFKSLGGIHLDGMMREVLRRRGCASWTGRGSADSNMRGCAGAGSDVVCGKRGKTGGGWLYRAVRRFHPIDRKSLKNRSELCCFGALTPSTGEFFKSLGGIHLDRASARSAAVCSERESTAAAGCIER